MAASSFGGLCTKGCATAPWDNNSLADTALSCRDELDHHHRHRAQLRFVGCRGGVLFRVHSVSVEATTRLARALVGLISVKATGSQQRHKRLTINDMERRHHEARNLGLSAIDCVAIRPGGRMRLRADGVVRPTQQSRPACRAVLLGTKVKFHLALPGRAKPERRLME